MNLEYDKCEAMYSKGYDDAIDDFYYLLLRSPAVVTALMFAKNTDEVHRILKKQYNLAKEFCSGSNDE